LSEQQTHHYDAAASGRLKFAIAFTAAVLVAEAVGGYLSNSLALISDAGHVFMDMCALGLALFALSVACRPVDHRRTYGWHRAEVFAALINGLLLLVLASGILYEAWERFHQADVHIKAAGMMVIAVIGLVANGIVALRLRGHHHGDLNLRTAFLHVLGDMFASVGVVIGGLVILTTGHTWIDPLIAAAIALLIVAGALRVLRDALHILFEGVPKGIKIDQVAAAIDAIDGVVAAHHLHIWSICSNVLVLSCHVAVDSTVTSGDKLIRTINQVLAERFSIFDTTIQIDEVRGPHETLIAEVEHREHEQPHA